MDRSLIDRYEAQGAELARWIEGLSAEQLDARPIKGKLTIRELVVHVYDSDLTGQERMRRVIAMQGDAHDDAPPGSPPVLLGYDQDKFIARVPSADVDLAHVCRAFALDRSIQAVRLRPLPDKAFARVGDHSEVGILSLGDLVKGYIEHFDHHQKFLDAKREALGVGRLEV